MYFANMYAYGSHRHTIGITGFVSCIGVVFVGNASMHAVHIPDSVSNPPLNGGNAFVAHVQNNEQNTGTGHLFLFANGTNRGPASIYPVETQAAAIKAQLGNPATTVFRINRNLGPNSGTAGANSAVVMVARFLTALGNPSNCLMWYKPEAQVNWDAAKGTAPAGRYDQRIPADTNAPGDISAGWFPIDNTNCTVTAI